MKPLDDVHRANIPKIKRSEINIHKNWIIAFIVYNICYDIF